MAIQGLNTTNYGGEVLEHVLTLATTGNELVNKGLIMVIPGVNSAISIPRVKTGRMLQKRKEDPTKSDSKGDFTYSERKLTPKDMMAFTLFNPRAFEHIWRPFQPTGDLVFRQLPANIQSLLLSELLKQVGHELGYQYINGKYEDGSDDMLLMDGILTQAAKDEDVVKVKTVGTTMLARLKELRTVIPVTMRNNPNLRILMSVTDFDTYDDELTQLTNKGTAPTDINQERYKGIPFEVLTICDSGMNGNLFAAVNLQDDENVIQIDKWANASELYFFKMLMKADTQIGFGEEFIALDWRADGAFKPAEG